MRKSNIPASGKHPIRYFLEGLDGHTSNSIGMDIPFSVESSLPDQKGRKHRVCECDHRQMTHVDASRDNNHLALSIWWSDDGGRTIKPWRLTKTDKRRIRKRAHRRRVTTAGSL